MKRTAMDDLIMGKEMNTSKTNQDEDTRKIQLPPLPVDINLAELCVIWIYAALSKEERLEALEGMNSVIERERIDALEQGKEWKEEPFSVEDFALFMNRLIGTITSGACDLAGIVYQKRFIKGMSRDELIKETGSENHLMIVISDYYDIRMKEEKKKYS